MADWYADDYYGRSPQENPTCPDSGEYRALRGGSWYLPLVVKRRPMFTTHGRVVFTRHSRVMFTTLADRVWVT